VADKEVMDPERGEAFGYHRYASADAQLLLGQHDRLLTWAGYSWTGMRDGESIQGPAFLVTYSHTTRKFQANITPAYESPPFRDETSYIPLVGFAYLDTWFQYLLEPKIPGVVFIRPQLYSSAFLDPRRDELLAEYKTFPAINARLAGQNFVTLGYSQQFERHEDVALTQRSFSIDLSSQTFQTVNWSAGIREGERIYYGDLSLGYAFSPYLNLTLRPTSWLKASATVRREVFLEQPRFSLAYVADRLGGAPRPAFKYDQSVFRGVLTVNFNPSWSLLAIGHGGLIDQPDDRSARLNWKVVLSWLPHPGTAAYLGVSHGSEYDSDGLIDDSNDWRVFLKLSYLWQV
jgi:hypothetical protein